MRGSRTTTASGQRDVGRPGGLTPLLLVASVVLAGCGHLGPPDLRGPIDRVDPPSQEHRGFGTQIALAKETGRAATAHVLDDPGGKHPEAFVSLLERNGTGWVLDRTIKLPDSVGSHVDSFSLDLGDGGRRLAVGVPSASSAAGGPGAVFLLELPPDGTVSFGRLVSPNASKATNFGSEVRFDEEADTLVVTDPGASASYGHGLVHVFQRTNGSWSVDATLEGPWDADEQFGVSADVDSRGQTVAVGANDGVGPDCSSKRKHPHNDGAVAIFERRNESWQQTQRLTPLGIEDYRMWAGNTSCYNLGSTVSFEHHGRSEELAVLSVPAEPAQERTLGFFFRPSHQGDGWVQGRPALYWRSVDRTSPDIAHGHWVMATTEANRTSGGNVSGFQILEGWWGEDIRFHPPENEEAGGFGRSFETVDDQLLVGAPEAEVDGERSGAIYIFDTRWG